MKLFVYILKLVIHFSDDGTTIHLWNEMWFLCCSIYFFSISIVARGRAINIYEYLYFILFFCSSGADDIDVANTLASLKDVHNASHLSDHERKLRRIRSVELF